MYKILLLLALPVAFAQAPTQSTPAQWNFTTTPPPNCSVGQPGFQRDGDPGLTDWRCNPLNTWNPSLGIKVLGTSNQIDAILNFRTVTISIPNNPVLPGTTSGTFSGPLTGNVTGDVTGSASSATGNAGTATALQTPRTINGVSFDGTSNIVVTANLPSDPAACSPGQYATDISASGALTCAQVPYSQVSGTPSLAPIATSGSASDLTTGIVPAARGGAGTVSGIMKANGTGGVSAAVAGADYVIPAGNVATATSLAANPADCAVGQFSNAIAANGDLSCTPVDYAQVTGKPTFAAVALTGSASDLTTGTLASARGGAGAVNGLMKANGSGVVSAASAGTDYVTPAGNVATATSLAANGTNCAAGQAARGVDASGNAENCFTPAISYNNHSIFTGSAPSVSACGTGATLAAGSTDNAGTINVGSGIAVLSCTLTFSNSFSFNPSCQVSSSALLSLSLTPSTSNLAINLNLNLGGGKLFYQCF